MKKYKPCFAHHKALPLILLFLFQFTAFDLHAQGRKHYLTKGGDGGMMLKGENYQPGDTLVLQSGLSPISYVYIGGFKGTKEKPVVMINEGGPVILTTGFDIEHSQYFKLSGSGTKDKYGFQVKGSSGVAVTIHGKSAHIEVERYSAEDCAFGCWIKNEASCDTSINNWVLNDISVHDYRMINLKIEGFYMGSTDANNISRPVNCDGVQRYAKPSKLGNIKVYNGFIDGTGRPAIMLSNAQIGMSEIYNNVISNVGREFNDQQGTGISLGLYTRAYVHNNIVKNTLTWGIASLGGSGMIRIENNTVDSSGWLDGKLTGWAQNIAIDTRNTSPVDSTFFIIRNNKLSNPGFDAEHIRVWKTLATYGSGNIICDNIIKGKAPKVVVEQGIKWKLCKDLPPKKKSSSSWVFWIVAGGAGLGCLALLVSRAVSRKGTKLAKPLGS